MGQTPYASICLECGEQFHSRFWVTSAMKHFSHARSHSQLRDKLNSEGAEAIFTSVTTPDGTEVTVVGDLTDIDGEVEENLVYTNSGEVSVVPPTEVAD